ncbi:MAG: NAD-dependent deacetylase [Ruaniaceae bacterium]|nr:NAD-dependent deacetylase [Ruaniaceae bacterium]
MPPVELRRVRDPLANVPTPQPRGTVADSFALLDPARTAVITGAGVSTDSGIPDYRSPGSPPRSPMTGQAFRASDANRQLYWARAYVGWERYQLFRPNSIHRDLAALIPGPVITQNVDGLHSEAGSRSVVELHGSLHRVICLSCGRVYTRGWTQLALAELNPGFLATANVTPIDVETNPDGDVELAKVDGFRVPNCPACGGLLKPDVVYFGESVRPEVASAAEHAIEDADAVLVLGSSLAVHSALRLVRQAVRAGTPAVIVTDGPTRADDLATVRVVDRVAPYVTAWRHAVT